jgi:AMP-binding enzyme C-terminal domain
MPDASRTAVSSEIEGRWTTGVVLKRDVLSTVERGRFDGIDAVRRRIDQVPWWTFPLALHLFRRERRALTAAAGLGVAPPLLYGGERMLVRGWIDGIALHLAKPHGDRAYFSLAKAALRKLHRAGICHNDLAKEQNWLRGRDGSASLTDFQLAMRFKSRTRLFRIAAYEDLRHLLKHKRRYAPDALTSTERHVLARKSVPTRIWMASGKRVYYWITRGLFRFTDREGGGPRLVNDAPRIAAALRTHPQVRDIAVVAYPDRRSGVGLYAFVEGNPDLSEADLRAFMTRKFEPDRLKPPEHVQVAEVLPRGGDGEIRTEVLQLVALNQVELVDLMIRSDDERAVVNRLLVERRNLLDRFSF